MYDIHLSEKSPVISTPESPRRCFNIAYLKSDDGCLKLLQFLLGMICVGLISAQYNYCRYITDSFGAQEQLFFLMTTTFTISTLISIVSNLVAAPIDSSNAERMHNVIFPGAASFILIATGLILYDRIMQSPEIYNSELLVVALSFCMADALVYAFGSCYAFYKL